MDQIEKRDSRVVEMYHEGYLFREIAEEMNLSVGSVYHILDRDAPFRPFRHAGRNPGRRIKKICAHSPCGKEFEVIPSQDHRKFCSTTCTGKSAGSSYRKVARNMAIVEQYGSGLTMREVGGRHQISVERVRQILEGLAPEIIRKPGFSQKERKRVRVEKLCEKCEKVMSLTPGGARTRRFCSLKCAASRLRNTNSQRAYEHRKTGLRWGDVADLVGYASDLSAQQSARRYALREGLEWPVR